MSEAPITDIDPTHKFCPIKGVGQPCIHSDCAWWNETTDRCIVHSFENINYWMETISYEIRNR